MRFLTGLLAFIGFLFLLWALTLDTTTAFLPVVIGIVGSAFFIGGILLRGGYGK